MPVPQQCREGESPPVEARLQLGDGEVIAGTIATERERARPFHGWLELMDALEEIRAGETCPQREER